ncbi:MAG: PepSY-associated TM helix domain-containing protein [Gammaproteobacteria bacterium]|nr:PepSY-associated TM helix domain-containing protein [Gammaproteobacteria bacterium]
MAETFRRSMSWLHTWAGVLLGSLLFAMFWMGSLSVFDREIDRWMMPATRLAAAAAPVSLDRDVVPVLQQLAADSPQWSISLPSTRTPVIRLQYQGADRQRQRRDIDPGSGVLLADPGSFGGTGFLYPFHYMLHIKWRQLGYWIVGLAAMAMLVLLVSGVVIHRKLITDFFLFRPRKSLQRASLDLHNLSGVLALPFHLLIALSGLIIFMVLYFPSAPLTTYADAADAQRAFTDEAYGRYSREPAGRPGALASLDAMVAQAQQQWQGGQVSTLRVHHPGDALAVVELRRSAADDLRMNLDQIYFDGVTGAVLRRFEAAPVMSFQSLLSGLHLVQFRHAALRGLYFLLGLSGCVMIATGFLFWLEARRASHLKKGLKGVRIVEALTIGSVTGIVIATLAFFVANQLLPPDVQWLGVDRAGLEVRVFYAVWLASFAHAAGRPRQGWREQTAVIALLSALAALLDVRATGVVLFTDVPAQQAALGMDVVLLLAAAGAGLALWRMRDRPAWLRGGSPATPIGQVKHG